MRLAFVTPPPIKPCEPGLSAGAAASAFRARGVDAFSLDASLDWHAHTLSPARRAQALAAAEARGEATVALGQAARADLGALTRAATYARRPVYSSAINTLENALRLASVPYPGFRLRIADVEVDAFRPQRTADLAAVAAAPGPFDAYFVEELLPRLARERVTHVGVSLTFLQQVWAAFRLGALLKAHLPGVTRWLGGPLVACWREVGAPLDGAPFDLFDRVTSGGTEAELDALALELGGHAAAPRDVMTPDLADVDWSGYLAPMPIVPAALGRGCYWRRCTFCPDHLHPHFEPCRRDALADWLEAVAARFPDGAMLHLTDSALAPAQLDRVAEVIRRGRLPLKWHGFVRLEAKFADRAFAQHLAEGGCVLLQWGLETAAPRLLELMDKGVTPEQSRAVLRSTAAAGIRNHAYLLFGLPTETEAERELTLDFVHAEAGALHDLNVSILNLPRGSPMYVAPERYGITALSTFAGDAELSLYADFRCGDAHPRLEARRWIARRFMKDPAVKRLLGDLNAPFKANHGCFLPAT